MILKKSTYWSVLLLISSFVCVGYYNQLSTSDVTAALKLFKIEFSKKNTKTLLPYIKKTLRFIVMLFLGKRLSNYLGKFLIKIQIIF